MLRLASGWNSSRQAQRIQLFFVGFCLYNGLAALLRRELKFWLAQGFLGCVVFWRRGFYGDVDNSARGGE